MTTREIEIEAEPIDAFEATQEILERAVTEGAFKIALDEAPRHYAIEWSTRMAGARYDFRIERSGGHRSQLEAQLEFTGLLRPLLILVRGAGNGPHLEQIIGDIKSLAESEEFYEDEEDGGADEVPEESENEE